MILRSIFLAAREVSGSRMRLRRAFCAGVLACTLAPTAAHAEVIERIVAVVNSDIILQSELNLRVVAEEQQGDAVGDEKFAAARRKKLAAAMLERMVSDELITQQAAALRLKVSAAEVNKALLDVQKKNKLSPEQLEQALLAEGFTMEQYRADVKHQILRLKVLNVEVRSRVQVSDAEVLERYQKTLAAGAASELHVRHIFFEIPTDADGRADDNVVAKQRERADKALARVRGGEDFAEVARAESEDPASKTDGGDIGWVARGILPEALDDVLFSMKSGEIRGPLRGEAGFHVVQVVELRTAKPQAFEEVKKRLRAELEREQEAAQTQAWLDKLKSKAYVKKRL